jgi:NAD(P)-dependent dehydrogenase (short-subunit alcohol dehydrogenase family)
MRLHGKRVLVTGGSSGIGLATARGLLAKGAKLAVTGRRPDVLAAAVKDLQASGGFVQGVAADVGTAEGRR